MSKFIYWQLIFSKYNYCFYQFYQSHTLSHTNSTDNLITFYFHHFPDTKHLTNTYKYPYYFHLPKLFLSAPLVSPQKKGKTTKEVT